MTVSSFPGKREASSELNWKQLIFLLIPVGQKKSQQHKANISTLKNFSENNLGLVPVNTIRKIKGLALQIPC